MGGQALTDQPARLSGGPLRRGRVVQPGVLALPASGTVCRHRLVVWAEQRWRWRVAVRCELCGREVWMPGRWWRERDVRQAVARTIARIDQGATAPP